MNGYDLDGTLCNSTPKRNKPFFKQTGEERKAHQLVQVDHYVNAKLMMTPMEPFTIITGRKEKYRKETEAWVRAQGLQPKGIFLHTGQRTREEMIAHKVDCCKRLKVTTYFEDDPKIAQAMRGYGVNVILIKHK